MTVRPDPLHWLGYVFGAGLPERNREWVLHDVTAPTWAVRHMLRAVLQLVPFAKAYSGLTDEEILEVDRIVRRTTVEKFGPVRSVRPALVFELGFEGINRSSRHKSGVAVRFPRVLRVRRDRPRSCGAAEKRD